MCCFASKIYKRMKQIFFILSISLFLQFCDNPERTAPEIPDESNFIIEFPDFILETKDSSNFKFASEKLMLWESIISDSLLIAKKSYTEAVKNAESVYLKENTWLRTFYFNENSADFTAKLYCKTENDSLDLKMYITRAGEYENFFWFKGFCDINMTSGTWTFIDKPSVNEYKPKELLLIEWNITGESNYLIKYTNIEQGSSQNGNYIAYNMSLDENCTDVYNIYNKGQDSFIKIELNRSTKKGRIKSITHYSDEEWHCWNEEFEDVECE